MSKLTCFKCNSECKFTFLHYSNIPQYAKIRKTCKNCKNEWEGWVLIENLKNYNL